MTMKKNFKRWLAILAVFALMSVSVFSNASVSAKAVEGDAEQQEETINQSETDTEISEIGEVSETEDVDEETDTEGDEKDGEDEESEGEDGDEVDESPEPEPERKMLKAGKMMFGATPGGQGGDSGQIQFDINDGGSVSYSVDGGSNWNGVSNNSSITPTSPSDGKVYLKAEPSDGKIIDNHENQLCVRYDDTDYFLSSDDLTDLESGSYSFDYDSSKNYSVRILFDNGAGPGPGPDPGSTPMSTFSMTYKEGSLGNGTVYYQSGSDEWLEYTGGEVEFSRLVIEPVNDGKEYLLDLGAIMQHANAEDVENPDDPEPNNDEVWGLISARFDGGGIYAPRGWKYTFSNIRLVEDDRSPSTLTVGAYDNSNGRFYYLDMDYEEHIVPEEGATSVEAKEIWVESNDGYILEDSLTVTGKDGEQDISAEDINELKGILLRGEHYWLDREKQYSFSGITFKSDDRPLAELTVASYENSNGKVWYQKEDDTWEEVPASGVTEVSAKAVKAEGREPKYTLRETRDGKTGWQISVSGGPYDDTEGTKREFENHFSSDQQADLMLGLSYSLSNIVFEEGRATFRWSYSDNIPGHEDEYVGHGRIEIQSASYNGETVPNPGDHDQPVYWINNSNFNEGSYQWQGGEGAFLPGTVVTIVLVPDRGYQLTRFQINGQANTTQAQGAISTFTFTVPSKNFHLGASFTEMNDEVKSNASGISGGSLEIGDSEFSTGTAALAVNNTTVDGTEESAFAEQAEGYNVDKYVDLAVQNIFYKGNTTDYWPGEEKHQLAAPASISLNVSGISGTEVEIVHQKSSGEYEVIPATYSNGVVTFNADSFSKFAIVSKGAKPSPSPSPTSSPKEEPAKQETSSENTSVVPVTVPDTTVVASIGGTTVTEKDTKDNVAVMVGGTKNGAKISEWNELAAYLATPQTATPMGTTSQTASLLAKPIELVLCKKNTVVPETVFDSLTVNPAPSMHIHIRDGVAINFINDANLTNQQAVDLKCVITSQNGYANRISFNSNAMLNAITTIHATVPKTVKSVNVYTIDKQGKKTLLWANIPVIDGRYCFLINQLGTFEIEVTPQS